MDEPREPDRFHRAREHRHNGAPDPSGDSTRCIAQSHPSILSAINNTTRNAVSSTATSTPPTSRCVIFRYFSIPMSGGTSVTGLF